MKQNFVSSSKLSMSSLLIKSCVYLSVPLHVCYLKSRKRGRELSEEIFIGLKIILLETSQSFTSMYQEVFDQERARKTLNDFRPKSASYEWQSASHLIAVKNAQIEKKCTWGQARTNYISNTIWHNPTILEAFFRISYSICSNSNQLY